MRVTHIITRLIVGGAQENTVATVLGLRQRPGIETALLAGPTTGPEGSMEPAFASCPQVCSIVPSLVRPVHPLKDLAALLALTRILRLTRPDLVHTHSGKAGILGRWAAHRAGVPIVVHTIHGPSFGPFQAAPAEPRFSRRGTLRREIHHSLRQRGRCHDPPISGRRHRPARSIYPHFQQVPAATFSGRGKRPGVARAPGPRAGRFRHWHDLAPIQTEGA